MSPDQKIAAMAKIFDRCLSLAKAKGHDYNDGTDGLRNFRTFGWKGIVVRLNDKMERMVQFCKTGTFKVSSESVEDTLIDIINYSALALIMYREENKVTGGAAGVSPCQDAEKSTAGTSIDRLKISQDAFNKLYRDLLDNAIELPARPGFFYRTTGV